jgi:hypothetical protein
MFFKGDKMIMMGEKEVVGMLRFKKAAGAKADSKRWQ